MDSRQYEQKIEQLEVEYSGLEGFLNEIINLVNLFIPILKTIPQTDKRLVAELEKRVLLANRMLTMKRNAPPTIVQSMGF